MMAGPIVERADADEDGKVTLEELRSAADELFDEFDSAKTGQMDQATLGKMLGKLVSPGRP